MKKFNVNTAKRSDMVNITGQVQRCVDDIGIKSGVVHVFIPHTTAGVSINENADPDVTRDVMFALERAVPNEGFDHFEGNSDAHTKAQLTGFSAAVIVEEGRLMLGTWQGIYFCEFDGPRRRQVFVQGTSCG
jgi:secondary thiamine-phosphate synthase enzyme